MRKQKHISFIDWINTKGTGEVARLLDVTPSTVRQWRRGYCYPRIDQMRQIKKVSKGAVGYEQIIDSSPLGTIR